LVGIKIARAHDASDDPELIT